MFSLACRFSVCITHLPPLPLCVLLWYLAPFECELHGQFNNWNLNVTAPWLAAGSCQNLHCSFSFDETVSKQGTVRIKMVQLKFLGIFFKQCSGILMFPFGSKWNKVPFCYAISNEVDNFILPHIIPQLPTQSLISLHPFIMSTCLHQSYIPTQVFIMEQVWMYYICFTPVVIIVCKYSGQM